MKNILMFWILLCVHLSSWCQGAKEDHTQIDIKYGILAKPMPDSIVIRFAPLKSYMLQAHSIGGVWLDRLIVKKGKSNYKWERINATPIKPWEEDKFNTNACKKDDYAMTVAMLLYGNLKSGSEQDELGNMKQKAEMLNSLFSLSVLGCDLSVLAAKSFGARWVDSYKIKENEKVFYRIYSAVNHPLFKVDTSITFVTYTEIGVKQAPRFLKAVSGEGIVELSFDFNKNFERWSAFQIERSSDGGNTFQRINKKPFLVMDTSRITKIYYRDSVQNYKPYYYRVQGIDPFAEVSDYSDVVMGFGRDKTPPGSLALESEDLGENGIKLSWKFSETPVSKDLNGFIIRKGPEINNMNIEVKKVNATTFSFYDPTAATKHSVYYEVLAVDTAGNISFSNPVRYFLPDTEPPKEPEGIQGTIDSNGIVSLHWQLDTLDEILGYRVYRTNDVKHEMVCLQEGYLHSNSFSDTLSSKTLTREVYYAVVAVDYSYNHSHKSKLIKLIKPDKVPPIAPQFIDYSVNEKGVFLKWILSSSSDVKEYLLIRKMVADTTKKVSFKIPRSMDSFIDTLLSDQTFYQYNLIALDSSGNRSAISLPIVIKSYLSSKEEDLGLHWMDPQFKTGFFWLKPSQTPLFYIVYLDDGKGLEQFCNAKADETKFILPKSIDIKALVGLGLQAIYPNQIKSKIYIIK